MPQPIITPARFLGRGSLPQELASIRLAILGFCRFYGMRDKLAAQPLGESLFSHLGLAHQFVAQVKGRKVLALECLYGGPLSATVLEELAHYGIQRAIGYGYAGSLTRDTGVGQLVLARSAIVSDGTSREYLPDARLVGPDAGLAQLLLECAAGRGIAIRQATVWTTDAIYREYPQKVARWREAGAGIVNMDTGPFYAVSQVVGISAAYACVVSDCVEGPEWDDGFPRVKEAMGQLQDVVVEAAARCARGDTA